MACAAMFSTGAIERGISLLIAVDCGSNDLAMIEDARASRARCRRHRSSSDRRSRFPTERRIVNPQRELVRRLRAMTAAGLAYLVVVCLAREGFELRRPARTSVSTSTSRRSERSAMSARCAASMNRAIVHAGVRYSSRRGGRACARWPGRQSSICDAMTAEDYLVQDHAEAQCPGRLAIPGHRVRVAGRDRHGLGRGAREGRAGGRSGAQGPIRAVALRGAGGAGRRRRR